jgi:hypothetical protein
VDLDGCIADDRWRRCNIQVAGHPDRFHAYHRLCHQDNILNRAEISEALIVILTGRPLRYHVETERWLYRHNIKPLHIIYRNNNDHCPSVILKRRMVEGLLDANSYALHQSEIVSAIDDRADVVEMYRTVFNFNARIVRIGEEEHANG